MAPGKAREMNVTVERVTAKAKASKITAGDGPWPQMQIVMTCDLDPMLFQYLGARTGKKIHVACEDYQGELAFETLSKYRADEDKPRARQTSIPGVRRGGIPPAIAGTRKPRAARAKPRAKTGKAKRSKPPRETIFEPEVVEGGEMA